MYDGFSVVLSESPAPWNVPWGSRHLLWLHTTSAGQTLRVSWSGPALSSAADGPESWRRHQPQLRSRAQSSLLVVSPLKTKKPQMYHVNAIMIDKTVSASFGGSAGGDGPGTGLDGMTCRDSRSAEFYLFVFFFFQLYNPVSWIVATMLYTSSLDLIHCSNLLSEVFAD